MGKRTKGLKPIRFDFGATSEVRKLEIAVEGFEPFTIEFRVPSALTKIGNKLAFAGVVTGEDDLAARGEAAIRYCAGHLVRWSLEPAPSFEALAALAAGNEAAFWAIAGAIGNAEAARKN